MKNKLVTMLALACLPVVALAAPDFNGSWVRDNAKSDKDPYPLYWLTRGVESGGGGGGGGEYVIAVRQDAASVQITVTAGLKGDTLVIGTVQPFAGMPGNSTLQMNEVWALSPDGKPLTVTTTREVPAQKVTIKAIYHRK